MESHPPRFSWEILLPCPVVSFVTISHLIFLWHNLWWVTSSCWAESDILNYGNNWSSELCSLYSGLRTRPFCNEPIIRSNSPFRIIFISYHYKNDDCYNILKKKPFSYLKMFYFQSTLTTGLNCACIMEIIHKRFVRWDWMWHLNLFFFWPMYHYRILHHISKRIYWVKFS